MLVPEILGPLQEDEFLRLHGHGLLWGVELLPPRGAKDLERLKQLCHQENVWPYFVEAPKKGFMISPALDISEAHLREGLRRLARALQALKSCP